MSPILDSVTMTGPDGIEHDITPLMTAGPAITSNDCRSFAAAWLNVGLAAADDPDLPPVLYRTILVEVHRDATRLVATNSHLILYSTVGEPTPVDEAPLASYVVMDPDRRGYALMKWAHKCCVRADKAEIDSPPLTVTVAVADPQGPPTLAPTMQRKALTLSLGGSEEVSLDIYEAEYPAWRHLTDTDPEAAERVAFNPEYLAVLAKLVDTLGPAEFTFAGAERLTAIHVDGEPDIDGALMPMHVPGQAS